ncbi:penicillin-binding transpeptidase domain-containing protein [Streptosporangium lutulentum]
MQAAADKAIKDRVFTTDNPVAAEALVEPGTGEIKALAASRKYGTDKKKNEISYNLLANVAHGGGIGFQAGSTFKVFTLLTALDQGMKINDGLQAPAGYTAPGYASFKNCKGGNIGDPTHTVTNDEGSGGFKTLQTGTWQSVNTFFLALEQRVGLCDVVTTAKSLGIKRADGQALQEYETFTLGINEMDPVTVATAYAAIGARGEYCPPQAITAITDRDGKTTSYEPQCRQALDPEVADAAADILSGVFTKGTMSAVGGIGRPAAGKTGTSDDSSTAWFAGFTRTSPARSASATPRSERPQAEQRDHRRPVLPRGLRRGHLRPDLEVHHDQRAEGHRGHALHPDQQRALRRLQHQLPAPEGPGGGRRGPRRCGPRDRSERQARPRHAERQPRRPRRPRPGTRPGTRPRSGTRQGRAWQLISDRAPVPAG